MVARLPVYRVVVAMRIRWCVFIFCPARCIKQNYKHTLGEPVVRGVLCLPDAHMLLGLLS